MPKIRFNKFRENITAGGKMSNKKHFSEAVLEDSEIIDLYWHRNEHAIAATDKKYRNYLFKVAYNILIDELDCEECLNDTYLKTWNKIPPTKPNVFGVFLAKITRDTAVDKYRENHRVKHIPSEMVRSLDEFDGYLPDEYSVEEEFFINSMIKILNEYISSLSSREEFIFICRYYYADTVEHIATMLGVTERTVFRYLSKMKEGLRVRLEKEGYKI